jgi:hypothetical protein
VVEQLGEGGEWVAGRRHGVDLLDREKVPAPVAV